MPNTRSKAKNGGGEDEKWYDRLSQREDVMQTAVRTANYFGPQATEGHQLLTERRLREYVAVRPDQGVLIADQFPLLQFTRSNPSMCVCRANPHSYGEEKVRHAAMRMADHAAAKPLPTSRPQTVNGITKSETIMKEHRDYKAWRAQLESEAIEEVKKDMGAKKQMTKLLQKRFRSEIPNPTGGVEGDWRPALW